MRTAAVQVVLLADSGEEKKAGPLALAIILVLFIACYFLFRSMTRHLRKVRTQFPVGRAVEPPGAGGSGGSSAAQVDAPAAAEPDGSSAASVDAGPGESSAAAVDAPADAADNLTGSRDPADSRPPAHPPEPSPPS